MRRAPGNPSISARLILLFPGSLEILTFEVWINLPIEDSPLRRLDHELSERFQQFRDGKRASRFHKSREQAARIRSVGNRILLSPKQFPGKGVEVRIVCLARYGVVRGDQSVIDENFDILAVESNFSIQPRFRFQTLARLESRACGQCQVVLIAPVLQSLPVVANTQAVAGVVDAVVSLVPDQDDSRTRGDMRVIGDVDQQLIAVLVFNPAVKYGNQWLEAGILGTLEEKLHIDVLKLHAWGSRSSGVRRRRNSIVATVRGVNKKLSLIDQIT